jgi:hypothetical protein
MNFAELNSIALNGGLLNNTGFVEIPAQISVNTNPSFASFVEIPASISVGSEVISEVQGSITVSDYAWMTNTLIAAQQQSGLRPYFAVNIVDDTIQPEAILSAPGAPINGSIVSAPDGNLLAVGGDGSGNMCFWKITNPSGSWTSQNKHVFTSTYLSQFNASIGVSNWYRGTYVIDIYYHIANSGNINIVHYQSLDGGLTWSSSITTNAPGISSSTSSNVYLAAVSPWVNADSSISSLFFYIFNNSLWYDIYYQFYNSDQGSTFQTAVIWTNQVSSQDLIIHSIDAYRSSTGVINLAISAYHQWQDTITNANYGIYQTQLKNLTNGINDVWTNLTQIFTNISASTNNLNVYTYPKISYDGTYYWILFRAVVVTGQQSSQTQTTTNVVTQVYYFLVKSPDFENFSYPAPLIFTDGTIFTDTKANSWVNFQGTNVYVGGNGLMWEYQINSITADVTNSVLNYEINEAAGSASTMTLTIGNQNNQWYGASPTKPGASAIAANRKIYLDQGYYNASGNPESVPHDIFYIDDIQLNVTANTNDLVLQARNSYKALKTFTAKYAYDYRGPLYYTDPFDGTTLSNWNQISGTWQEIGSSPFFAIEPVGSPSTQALISHQIENPASSSEAVYCVYASFPTASISGETLYIYPYYADSNNNLLFQVQSDGANNHISIIATQGGITNIITSGQLLNSAYSGNIAPIVIHRFNYADYLFIIGSDYYNTVQSLDPNTSGITTPAPTMLSASGSSVNVGGTWQVRNGVFAMGAIGYEVNFSVFKHIEYADSLSIQDIVQRIGGLSGITSYNQTYSFNEDLYLPSNYSYDHAPTANAGYFTVNPSSSAMNTQFTMTNNEVEFKARMRPSSIGSGTSLNFFFRTSSNTTDFQTGYIWNIAWTPTQNHTSSRIKFRDTTQGGDFLFSSSSSIDYLPMGTYQNNLEFDLEQWHTYRLVAIDGWIFGFIDKRLVISWQDNHFKSNTHAAPTTGGIGFQTDSNTNADVQFIRCRTLWNQVQDFTISPGDEGDTDMLNLLQTIQGWVYSNLMGQFTSKLLLATESSSYTYQNGIVSSSTDNSDKEYVNQVTVYGLNVSAIAQDQNSISTTGRVREMTIIDYTILTYQDALSRANNELIHANQYLNQNTPQYPNNVGAQLFDVITIVNTGQNSSNINGNFRTYNQTIINPGSNGFYSVSLETGTL